MKLEPPEANVIPHCKGHFKELPGVIMKQQKGCVDGNGM